MAPDDAAAWDRLLAAEGTKQEFFNFLREGAKQFGVDLLSALEIDAGPPSRPSGL